MTHTTTTKCRLSRMRILLVASCAFLLVVSHNCHHNDKDNLISLPQQHESTKDHRIVISTTTAAVVTNGVTREKDSSHTFSATTPFHDGEDDTPTVPIVFSNQAWVVGRFKVQYTYQGNIWQWQSNLITVQHHKIVHIPTNATNILLEGEYSSGMQWMPLFGITLLRPPAPPHNCYTMQGTLFHMSWDGSCTMMTTTTGNLRGHHQVDTTTRPAITAWRRNKKAFDIPHSLIFWLEKRIEGVY